MKGGSLSKLKEWVLGAVFGNVLFAEGLVQEICDDGKVATLVIGRENDGVLVLGNWRHGDRIMAKERKKRRSQLNSRSINCQRSVVVVGYWARGG